MKNTLIAGTIIFVLILAACKKSNTNTTSNQTSTYTPSCSGTKSFKTDVFPLIQSSCNGCHSNLGSYAAVKADAANVRVYIANGSMPRSSTLTNAQKDIIMCWIDSGSPDN